MDLLASWPVYPESYGAFAFSFASLGRTALDAFHEERLCQINRMTLVADQERAGASAM